MKSLYTCLAAALLTMLSVACSSDDTKAATATGALGSCNAYCTKVGTNCASSDAGDDLVYASAAECNTSSSCADLTGLPAACEASSKAYYDCMGAQTNICADGCQDKFATMFTDCS